MSSAGYKAVGEIAYDVLTNQFSGQTDRIVGYYSSQSLRHLMRDLDVDDRDIIQIEGGRRVNETTNDIPWLEARGVSQYVDAKEVRRETVNLNFDRKTDGTFNWDAIETWLDKPANAEIYDIPITRLVFRFENDALHENLWEFIQEVYEEWKDVKLVDKNEFRQPFYAVMESRAPGSQKAHDAVETFHPKRYFLGGGQTDQDGERGLGQKFRTMDLAAIWSHQSFIDSKNLIHPSAGVTMRDMEEWVINHVKTDAEVYGAINSKLLVNKFRSALHQGVGRKRFEWEEQEGWVQRE